MTAFGAAIEAALDKGAISAEILLEFDLPDGPLCLWTGVGDLEALGKTWRGAGRITRLPELELLLNGQASRLTLEVSGVDAETIQHLAVEASQVDGREMSILFALFDSDLQMISTPQYLDVLVMDEVVSEQTVDNGVVRRKISLDVASPFAARSTSPLAYYTNQDQVARHPTDKGCERVGFYQNRTIGWPKY